VLLRLLAAALALLAIAPRTAVAADWVRPVPGAVVRPFAYAEADPFAPGRHRGADLAAAPGAPVRSACGGRVLFAGRMPGGGRGVTVACGRWRVTHLPLAAVAVRRGALVAPGRRVGTVAPGHGGLHLGVRRAGGPFGYVDPLARLDGRAPPPLAVRVPRAGPRRPAPRSPVRHAPAPRPRPRPAGRPAAVPAPGLAPWPVWAGLAALLAGAAGGSNLVRRRRARASRPLAAGAPIT
jgi:Peptidase family M23